MTRVAVTTDRFAEAGVAFDQVGFEPVWLPCIRVEPADDGVLAQARVAASMADLLLISSVRTLELLWPNGSMPAAKVAAVGERTAAAVAARGGRVLLIGRSGLADLVERVADRLGSSLVVFPHAGGSDPAALEALREQASDLHEFEVYRTVPVAPGSAVVQGAAFASPSAVEGWLLTRDFDGLVVGVIGLATWKAVARHRTPEVMAPRPSHQALARALASYLEVTV
ncbi:MAG: uroporphyrinogen-III synthase [Actinomycetota bacterium]